MNWYELIGIGITYSSAIAWFVGQNSTIRAALKQTKKDLKRMNKAILKLETIVWKKILINEKDRRQNEK